MNSAASCCTFPFQWQGTDNVYDVYLQPGEYSPKAQKSLLVSIRFIARTKMSGVLIGDDEEHQRFLNMEISALFEQRIEPVRSAAGMKCGEMYSYYLDFGQDYQGAARIVSQLLINYYNIGIHETIETHTEAVDLTEQKAHERQLTQRVEKNRTWAIIGGLIMLILFIMTLMGAFD